MTRWLIDLLVRSKGRIVALSSIGLMISGFALLGNQGPRRRWVESGPELLVSGQFNLPTIEYAPDGRSLLSHDQDRAEVRDLETGRVVKIGLGANSGGTRERWMIVDSEWMEGGRLLVGLVIEAEQPVDKHLMLQVWEMPSGREVFRKADLLAGNLDFSDYHAISDDGHTLAFLIGDQHSPEVCIWTLKGGEHARTYPGDGPIGLSANGRFLVLADGAQPGFTFQVRDLATGEIVTKLRLDGSPWQKHVAISPDGKWVACSQIENQSPFERTKAEQDADPEGLSVKVPLLSLHSVASSKKWMETTTYLSQRPWFSADGLLLYTNKPGPFPDQIQVWNLVAIPPASLYQGEIGSVSRDGRWMIQRGDSQNDFLRPMKFATEIGAGVGPSATKVQYGKVFQKGRGTHLMSIEGETLAYFSTWVQASPLSRMTSWLPPQMVPWGQGWSAVSKIEMIDPDTGRRLNSILLDDGAEAFEMALVSAGEMLILRSSRTIPDPATPPARLIETKTEVWDARPAGASLGQLGTMGIIAILALGCGEWYDRRSYRRAAKRLAVA